MICLLKNCPFPRHNYCYALSDYMQVQDDSKIHAISAREEPMLSHHEHVGQVLEFQNPAGYQFQLATFKQSEGIASESFSYQDTFFKNYNWRILQCPRCVRHIGYVISTFTIMQS